MSCERHPVGRIGHSDRLPEFGNLRPAAERRYVRRRFESGDDRDFSMVAIDPLK
jgi:hypothetical protein